MRDHRRHQARHHQIFDRVGGKRGQRVNLLGHLHGADLGGDGGGDAARHHQAGDHRAQFAGDAQHHDLGHDGFGAIAVAAQIDLQRQHAAGEEGGEPHHRQREIADAHHLADDQPAIDRRAETSAASVRAGELRQPADMGQHRENGAADARKKIH